VSAVHLLKVMSNLSRSLNLIRHSLGVCLLLYGCDRSKLLDSGLIKQEEVQKLPSRLVSESPYAVLL
jgi:hypothetical protein